MSTSSLYLSHILDNDTPTYGGEYPVSIKRSKDISEGAIANESEIHSTTHIGTHIDLPYHFYQEGQTIESYSADFWIFTSVLLIEISPEGEIIEQEIIEKIKEASAPQEIEILLIKTGMEAWRKTQRYIMENPGFSPELYNYLIANFPKLRAFGFDTISLTSYNHPLIGRQAHRSFLNPKQPLLIIEDMSLHPISEETMITQLVIAPLRIASCDGMPCTVIATIEEQTKRDMQT